MAHTMYALSSLTAPSAPSLSYTAVLDAATQTAVHYDDDGNEIAPARMADGTGTGTGNPKPDHDTD
jgi:putative ATP-grasp target RiPP